MWKRSGLTGTYDSWSFGGDPDGLAALCLSGKKRATSSAFPLYEAEGEELPQSGAYSVVADGKGEAVCIIQTRLVKIVPFSEITEEMAAKEGEGDGSLKYWQDVHRPFFTEEMAEAGLSFDESMKVVFEEFVRVYPPADDGQYPAMPKQGALYIIRHGKTDWNAQYRLQGRTDIPLNEEGRKMAREAAERYREELFEICFSSPLVRARETAELLLKGRDIPVTVDERLTEMAFGVCEGTSNCYNIPDSPVRVFFFHPEAYTNPAEGGESITDLIRRTGAFLEEKVYPLIREGKNVLLVGHGAMNMSLVVQVWDLPLEEFWTVGIENCKLLKLI